MYTFALALLIVAAGTVWAAQPAVSPRPVEAEGETVTEAPVPDTDPIFGELVFEPVDACCKAECYDEWSVCVNGCSSTDCKQQCTAERDQCIANC